MKPASFGHGCHFPAVMQGAIRIVKISPELFREMLNRSISVVYLVRSMVNYDQFQTTHHTGICCSCVRRLRLSTVSYGHLRSTTEESKFLYMLKIAPPKFQDGGSVPVDSRTSRSCLRTRDGYPTDNPGLKP